MTVKLQPIVFNDPAIVTADVVVTDLLDVDPIVSGSVVANVLEGTAAAPVLVTEADVDVRALVHGAGHRYTALPCAAEAVMVGSVSRSSGG